MTWAIVAVTTLRRKMKWISIQKTLEKTLMKLENINRSEDRLVDLVMGK